jgi:hypothetical protein
VKSEEHMLYTKEIASIYDLYLPNGDPRQKLVSNILKDYIKKNIENYERIYYETRYGLREVFSASIYEPAMEAYFKEGV